MQKLHPSQLYLVGWTNVAKHLDINHGNLDSNKVLFSIYERKLYFQPLVCPDSMEWCIAASDLPERAEMRTSGFSTASCQHDRMHCGQESKQGWERKSERAFLILESQRWDQECRKEGKCHSVPSRQPLGMPFTVFHVNSNSRGRYNVDTRIKQNG